MEIVETCPDCGAERPSWHGGSHVRKCLKHEYKSHQICCDGLTADEFWRTKHIPFTSIPLHWLQPA